MISKFLLLTFGFTFLLFTFTLTCFAKDVTILYTGETHAMLYPCSCPKEPDGGISRRGTLLKQLKKENPNTLVLDSGGFFAGGLLDEYTQNTELDIARTRVNLKAMELMQYDAVAVGDEEFNFGEEFLQEAIQNSNPAFLSSNIASKLFKPYIIKEVSGTKIGIIGVTTLQALPKAGGLKIIEPKIAIKKNIEELKKNGIDLVVLLSHLGEEEDLRLIEEIDGIDILIAGHSIGKEEPLSKIKSTLLLRPAWQGRHLGKLSLTIKDKRIENYKIEDLRLSDKIKDDPEIVSVLPGCFSDANCKKEGFVGFCQDPGTVNSRCLFSESKKINLLIITPKACRVCETERLVDYLKAHFPGLSPTYLYYPDAKSNKMIKDFTIKGLPVFLLGKEIEKEKGFVKLKESLEKKGDFYLLKPEFSGISYFLERKKINGKFDLFVSLYDKSTPELLDVIKEFGPEVHFLAVQQQDKLDAAKGNLEVEEYLRAVCVEKYEPQKFWDYISCRAKSIQSSWWEDCLKDRDIDKIRICSRGEEGIGLLKENISLNKELQIMFGPTYLLDNQEVFGSQGVPSKEDLKKILKK